MLAGRRPNPALVWGLIVTFLALLPAVTTRLNASDEIEYFAWLRSWAFDRDVDFENEYRHFYDEAPEKHAGLRDTFLDGRNQAGRRPNFAPVGTAVLWSPFFAVGHLVARLSGQAADGFSVPYIAAVTYASALFGLAALLLTVDFVRRLLGVPAGVATWSVWFGTPLLFYMYVAPGFSHAASAFVVSLVLWLWVRVRGEWAFGGTLMLGAAAGLLPMVREQDGFFLAVPAIDFGRWAWRSLAAAPTGATARRRLFGQAARIVLGGSVALLVYLPQMIGYTALNGRLRPDQVVVNKMSWSSPHFADVLASPHHGLFFWTPLAIVAVIGLVWLTVGRGVSWSSDQRWVGALLLLAVLLQAYISGAVESWTVAGGFGQRRFVSLTPVLAAGLAAALTWARATSGRRAGLTLVIALGIWWNVGLMAQFGLHLMDRQRLDLVANARTTFVRLPLEFPAIVWRYWTDRDSLFDLPRQR